MKTRGQSSEGNNQDNLWQNAVKGVINQICPERLPEHLLGVKAEDSFHRNKNNHEKHQPDTEPQKFEGERVNMLVHFHSRLIQFH